MMTVTGIFVQILRFWPCLLTFSLAILNFAASCAYGIPEHELNIMYARFGQSKMKLIKFFYHLCILNLVCLSNLWKYWTEKFLYLSQAKIKNILDETFITHLKKREKLALNHSKTFVITSWANIVQRTMCKL